jgi:hypothetical protein
LVIEVEVEVAMLLAVFRAFLTLSATKRMASSLFPAG